MSVEIKSVTTRKELKAFVQFYYDLYRNSPYAVPYLYSDELKTLTRDKNPAFAFCDTQYFMAYKDGRLCGRIAGIINRRANDHWQRKIVRFGWFDFTDDAEVADALLQAVADWGRRQGLTELVGPMGFEDMDREGMLVEGFDEISSMYVNYNYPYYPQHLERLGFVKDNDYVEYKIKVPEVTPQKFARTAGLIEKRYGLETRKFNRHDMVEGGRGRFRICRRTRLRGSSTSISRWPTSTSYAAWWTPTRTTSWWASVSHSPRSAMRCAKHATAVCGQWAGGRC